MFFSISIDFVIIDHISQLAKLVSFLYIARLLEVLFFAIITIRVRGGDKGDSIEGYS